MKQRAWIVFSVVAFALATWVMLQPQKSDSLQAPEPPLTRTSDALAPREPDVEVTPPPSNPSPIAGSLTPAEVEFTQLVTHTLGSLVKKEALQKLSAHETHELPKELANSALALGEIAERLKKNPTLLPAALQFYSRCASDRTIATSVRALCVARYRKHSSGSLPEGPIPQRVLHLADPVNFD